MILYHGSNQSIDRIDLSVCRPFKDFGKGFYLTTMEEQAQKMARRVAGIFGGTPTVNVFRLEDAVWQKEHLSLRRFPAATLEWALFVTANRTGNTTVENNLDEKYDIVIGPVADDDLSVLFRQFSDGLIGEEALRKGMEFRRLNDQYSFHTERAIAYLRKERTYHVQA